MKGLCTKNKIKVSTASGKMTLFVERDGNISVTMPVPQFEPSDKGITNIKIRLILFMFYS
jgi:diaminopimelate epimerase